MHTSKNIQPPPNDQCLPPRISFYFSDYGSEESLGRNLEDYHPYQIMKSEDVSVEFAVARALFPVVVNVVFHVKRRHENAVDQIQYSQCQQN